jgi:hypothetical protein
LTDIILVCHHCHYCIHQGFSYPEHYSKVNRCSREEYEKELAACRTADEEFRQREKERRRWKRVVDYGWFAPDVAEIAGEWEDGESWDPWNPDHRLIILDDQTLEFEPLGWTRNGTPIEEF